MASFIYKKSRNPNGGRELMTFLLKDSTAFTIGETVKFVSGALEVWAGGAGAGVIVAIEKADGTPVTDNGSGGDFTTVYTTPASNTVKAVIDVSTTSVYSAVMDGTPGSTNNSDDAGISIDALATGLGVDESTAQTAGTAAAFFSYGVDPDGQAATNSYLVSINESQLQGL